MFLAIKMAYLVSSIFGPQLNPLDVYRLSMRRDFLTMRWALSKGFNPHQFARDAARQGNLKLLKYLHDRGYTLTDLLLCAFAAMNGHPPASCHLIV